ncbi:HNH endonuclease family protein [Actinobaculum suis]|uniref:HNH endonuclease family protein n=2 Tax=Actinobaculum suis TaxID=1657 RepID=A0AAW9HMT3_9ACTO|nr:HNH endonuclease family protein [Actinobaculum suis]MDY5152513.1 HNH endonuclease family protein [Actinobaculum suis]
MAQSFRPSHHDSHQNRARREKLQRTLNGVGNSSRPGEGGPKTGKRRAPSRRKQERMRKTNRFIMLLIVLFVFGALVVDSFSWGKAGQEAQQPTDFISQPVAGGDALTAARNLPAATAANTDTQGKDYDRAEFGLGHGWPDTDGDGCNERNEILGQQLQNPKYWKGKNTPPHCVVGTGTLNDPYSGKKIHFNREKNPNSVQIDHVVALYDAWEKGAAQWVPAKRFALATDPLNLLAVSGHENESKGHSDAASWLPPNTAFHCEYVSRQVAVKQKYEIAVTAEERAAMVEVLETCPGQELPRT